MNEEFAIEPTAFEDVKDVKILLGKFGFHEGRFITALPGKWLKEVYNHFESFPDGIPKQQAKRLAEILKERGGIVSNGLNYDPTNTWLANAKSCESKLTGIVVSPSTPVEIRTGRIRAIGDIDDDSFFGSSRDTKIEATVEGYGKAAEKLLLASTEIYLIDPHFNFSRKANTDVLENFIRIGLAAKCKFFVVYVHVDSKPKGIDSILGKLTSKFPSAGLSLQVFYVEKGLSLNPVHPRYLLSRYGAIRFDKGFIVEQNTRHDVAPIDLDFHKELCRMYIDGGHGFTIESELIFPALPNG